MPTSKITSFDFEDLLEFLKFHKYKYTLLEDCKRTKTGKVVYEDKENNFIVEQMKVEESTFTILTVHNPKLGRKLNEHLKMEDFYSRVKKVTGKFIVLYIRNFDNVDLKEKERKLIQKRTK